ncbi:hypothetical protein ACXR0O_06290 [Verrucomicrobiota bacterium sgz303538]
MDIELKRTQQAIRHAAPHRGAREERPAERERVEDVLVECRESVIVKFLNTPSLESHMIASGSRNCIGQGKINRRL